jgi:hypothetical protein
VLQYGAATATTAAANDPHGQHPSGTTAAAPIAETAPGSKTEIRSIQPTATLKADLFDAPAPISVSEAAKASQAGGHEGHVMRGVTR